jgi:hypothetical protein
MKVAIVVYNGPADESFGYRALMTAREMKDAGDDVVLVFDGTGTETLASYLKPGQKPGALIESVRDRILGACGYCAQAHGVKDALVAAGIPLLTDYKGHASLRKLMLDGYQIITF